MELEHFEIPILIMCVSGFIGGCFSGYAMSRSLKKGFSWMTISVVVSVLAHVVYMFKWSAHAYNPRVLFALLLYSFLMSLLVLLPVTLGCSLTWLIFYLKRICARR